MRGLRSRTAEMLLGASKSGQLEQILSTFEDPELSLEKGVQPVQPEGDIKGKQVEDAAQKKDTPEATAAEGNVLGKLLITEIVSFEPADDPEASRATERSEGGVRPPEADETPLAPSNTAMVLVPADEPSVAPVTATLLQVLSTCDRRIGQLSALIRDMKRRVADKDDQCQRFQAELDLARRELRHLDLDIEHQQQLTRRAELETAELQEGKRRLADKIDIEILKQRHAEVDIESTIVSGRSDYSVASSYQSSAQAILSYPKEALTDRLAPCPEVGAGR